MCKRALALKQYAYKYYEWIFLKGRGHIRDKIKIAVSDLKKLNN